MDVRTHNSLDIANIGCVQPDNASELPIHARISGYEAADRNNPEKVELKSARTFRGIFDTGASCTVISSRVADALSLPVVSVCDVSTANGMAQHNCHLINLCLPAGVTFSAHHVTSGDIGDVDFLIGMDIIRRGDFSILQRHGFMVVTFSLYTPFHNPEIEK